MILDLFVSIPLYHTFFCPSILGRRHKDVRIVFVLDDNKSGASIAHIGSYDGAESEVTSPSGVKYHIDRIRKEQKDRSEIVFIDVHE